MGEKRGGGGGGGGGTVWVHVRCAKNRGTVVRPNNITVETPLAIKNMPDTCLQLSPFGTVILYSFCDTPPNKIGKHAWVKHFPNPRAKHAR